MLKRQYDFNLVRIPIPEKQLLYEIRAFFIHCSFIIIIFKLYVGFRAEIQETTFSFRKFWAVPCRFRVPLMSFNHVVSNRSQER